MKPELWQRIREVFELSLEATDIDVLIAQKCGDDVELRRAVLELVAADAISESLEPPSLRSDPKIEVGVGDRVGEFVIQRELERGGMGVVFEAEQNEPRRLVALKVLPTDSQAPTLTQRVQSEAEILARLQHPGIAAVYAAGVHLLPDGRGLPYIAMELVSGARNLLTFVDEVRLELRPRLRLFQQVCDAVHSAHQKGVIHRDLKPSNILVDRNGRVRVIDFGIAHLADFSEDKPPSEGGGVLGTPGYVSPERLLPGEDTHDVRSDIYSLGVVLSQLTGQTAPREFQWILDRAQAQTPADRYASAADLAADVLRFLSREPVLAGPSTARYLVRCFVRRHAAGVAAAIALATLLVAGLVGTTYGWSEAERLEATARKEGRRSGALRDVLRKLLVEASPQRQGPNVKLLDGLDSIVEDIEPAFVGQFDLQVLALCDVAHVQLEIGQWRRARTLLLRAVTIADTHLPDSYEQMASLNLLGISHQHLLESDKAVAVYRRAMAVAAFGGECEEIRQDIEQNLAAALTRADQLPQSVLRLEKSYRSSAERNGDDHRRTLSRGNTLAQAYQRIGRLDDALVLSERLLAAWRLHEKDTNEAVIRLHNHGHLLQHMGRYAEALAGERDVLVRWPKIVGAQHPHIATVLQSAGIFAWGAGEFAVAEQFFAKLVKHPSMADASARQQAVRPLLHATALVACGPEHFDAARRILTAHLDSAARYEEELGVFVWLARAAAARIAPELDAGRVAAAKRAYDELCDESDAENWTARLAERWLAERQLERSAATESAVDAHIETATEPGSKGK